MAFEWVCGRRIFSLFAVRWFVPLLLQLAACSSHPATLDENSYLPEPADLSCVYCIVSHLSPELASIT